METSKLNEIFKKVLTGYGVGHAFIEISRSTSTAILFTHEKDFLPAEKALAEIQGLFPLEWTHKLRPDSEILTERGFEPPPPTRDEILKRHGIEQYRLEIKPQGGYFLAVFQTDKSRAAEAIKECMVLLGDSFMDWELMILPPP